jgi:hypothetical protein
VRLLAFIAVVAALAPGVTSASLTKAPAIRIVDRIPLTVLGTGFRPRERVVVTALGDAAPARIRVIASRAGRFRAKLNIAFDPCTGPEVIRAAGVKGSVAQLKLSLRECPSPVLEP